MLLSCNRLIYNCTNITYNQVLITAPYIFVNYPSATGYRTERKGRRTTEQTDKRKHIFIGIYLFFYYSLRNVVNTSTKSKLCFFNYSFFFFPATSIYNLGCTRNLIPFIINIRYQSSCLTVKIYLQWTSIEFTKWQVCKYSNTNLERLSEEWLSPRDRDDTCNDH